jgi:hypothetical protein
MLYTGSNRGKVAKWVLQVRVKAKWDCRILYRHEGSATVSDSLMRLQDKAGKVSERSVQ